MNKVMLVLVGVVVGIMGVVLYKVPQERVEKGRLAELEKERDESRARCSSPIATQLAAVVAALHKARAASAPNPLQDKRDAHQLPGPGADGGDEPGENEENGADLVINWHAKSDAMVGELKHRAGITSDQEAKLQLAAAEMNRQLGEDIDRAKALSDKATSREAVEVGLDALTAVKKADDAFRASLSPQQRETLDREGFDILSQFDPMLLLRLSQPTTL